MHLIHDCHLGSHFTLHMPQYGRKNVPSLCHPLQCVDIGASVLVLRYPAGTVCVEEFRFFVVADPNQNNLHGKSPNLLS